MSDVVVYAYSGCGTCRKALSWLSAKGIACEVKPVRETPPSRKELQAALDAGLPLKSLFNISGGDYRELGLKDKLASMGVAEAIELLASRGNLVKRPFVVAKGRTLTGFSEESFADFFASDRRRS